MLRLLQRVKIKLKTLNVKVITKSKNKIKNL